MLSSGHPNRPAPSAPESGGAITRIAREATIQGDVQSAGDLHVDGSVTGTVRVQGLLFISPNGSVNGPVEARAVQLAGRVEGSVRGLERVDVLATAHLAGDVHSPRVTIAEGAYFQGELHMNAGATPPSAAART